MEGAIHAYCINLKHREDRWQRFSSQPELDIFKQHFTFERFEAVQGATVDLQKDGRLSLRTKRNIKNRTRRDHEELDSAGGVGCYLSHIAVWKKFLERPEQYAIVFEDDANLTPGFTGRLKAAMKDVTLLPRMPDYWTFAEYHEAYYDSRGQPNPKVVPTLNYGPWTTRACTTTTGYLLSKAGAQKLLETAFPIDMHVDMYMCLSSELGNIMAVSHKNVEVPAYALKDHDTDIATDKSCPICDVPTKYREKGMVIVSLPVAFLAFGSLAVLAYLGSRSKR